MSTYENLARRIYVLREDAALWEHQADRTAFTEQYLLRALNARAEAQLLATLADNSGLWETGEYRELGDCPACRGERTDPDTGGLCRVCCGDGKRTTPTRSFDEIPARVLCPVPDHPDLAA